VDNVFDPQISIIIPTLNEAEQLPSLLHDLKKQQAVSLEIIIADGGSGDGTQAVAESHGVRCVPTKRGRGAQMNAAAAEARGDLLFFLHADSRIDDPKLLAGAVAALTGEQEGSKQVAGHFTLRFLRSTRRNTLSYRYVEDKTAFNRVNTTNGDQGFLLSNVFFRQLGGFDERLPFLEDQRLAGKIRSQGRWITLPGYLKTSARRFEAEGFQRRYILMSMMMGLYSIGVDDFFERAPQVYRLQQDTGRLLLSPVFGLIWRMTCCDWGLVGTIRIFYALGRYIRQNSWQMFYFLDICLRPLLGAGRYPFLTFHDRVFGPCTNVSVINTFVGTICFIWFMGILASYFWIVEYGEQKKSSG
jgi:rSAM/selenodomain-associated transferase 2